MFFLVVGGFFFFKLVLLVSILIGEERVGNLVVRIKNSKECFKGENGSMIILWFFLSLLIGYIGSRWYNFIGSIYY